MVLYFDLIFFQAALIIMMKFGINESLILKQFIKS